MTAEKQATIHDVARRAGVSSQTVSRVINGGPHVSKKTHLIVAQAIQELDFRPNRTARALITGRSQTLQLITFAPYNAAAITPILVTARTMGYRTLLSAGRDDHLAEDFADLFSERVDGILLLMPRFEESYDKLREMARGTPMVVLGADMGADAASVLVDQRYGMRLVIEHLLALGHRQIVEVAGPVDKFFDARVRHDCYEDVMRANGIEPRSVGFGTFSSETGYRAAHDLFDRGERFTALVCANDDAALGAMHAIHERGLRVPADISVTGFDDGSNSAHFLPPLTTVRQDWVMLGTQSLEHMVAMINNPATPPHQRVLHPQLIVRASTAPLAGR